MNGGRCSTTEAINLLLPAAGEARDDYATPMAAAAKLGQAIREGRCDPRHDGVAARPELIPRLIVVVKPEKDGGWRARIENTSMSSDQPVDVWTFAIDEVMELRQRAEQARLAAKKPKPAGQSTETLKRKLVNAGLARLREKYPDKYPEGIPEDESPTLLIKQMKPIWADTCRAEGVSPADYPLSSSLRGTVARAIGRRKD